MNRELLAREFTKVKQKRNVTNKEVRWQSGVSESTLSRIENMVGGEPEAENVVKLCRWMGIPITEIMGADESGYVKYKAGAPTPDIIASFLRADPKLDALGAEALIEVFDVAYKLFTSDSMKCIHLKRKSCGLTAPTSKASGR